MLVSIQVNLYCAVPSIVWYLYKKIIIIIIIMIIIMIMMIMIMIIISKFSRQACT